ncbi:MAG: hypothetical protein JWO77_1400 [Ilumatobacteraceae bacterium]|nr:hypothetical protein [Ilumatobacteraceae bacterium]
MLRRFGATNFKSLVEVSLQLPRLTVLFGPNAVGKSNFLDGLVVLSRLASERTVGDALSEPVRGHPLELLSLPPDGLPGLVRQGTGKFSLQADLAPRGFPVGQLLRYGASIGVDPRSGEVRVLEEHLGRIYTSGKPVGNPKIETVDDEVRLRREKQGRPYVEAVGQGFTQLSNLRLTGEPYLTIESARDELSNIRTYYLDPRNAMRRGSPPKEVHDIGPLGGDLAPFLYRLKHVNPKAFNAVDRTLRAIIPGIQAVDATLDEQRGVIDVLIRQDGIDYPSRIVSEGTLRVLALCCIALNPWPGTVVAFEEPENGVHPRRLELVARLLFGMAQDRTQQVIVTSHSPLFCQEILRLKRESAFTDVGLVVAGRSGLQTKWRRFDEDTLFADDELVESFSSKAEDGLFEELVLRGLIDA